MLSNIIAFTFSFILSSATVNTLPSNSALSTLNKEAYNPTSKVASTFIGNKIFISSGLDQKVACVSVGFNLFHTLNLSDSSLKLLTIVFIFIAKSFVASPVTVSTL